MKIDWPTVGLERLAGIVSDHLRKNGVEAVLVGGACVSLYSDNKYMSFDLDLGTETPVRKIIPVLEELGFQSVGGRLFEHLRPAGPVRRSAFRPRRLFENNGSRRCRQFSRTDNWTAARFFSRQYLARHFT